MAPPRANARATGADRSTADQQALVTSLHHLGNFAGQTAQLNGIQRVPGRFREDSGTEFYNNTLPLIRHTKPVYIVTS